MYSTHTVHVYKWLGYMYYGDIIRTLCAFRQTAIHSAGDVYMYLIGPSVWFIWNCTYMYLQGIHIIDVGTSGAGHGPTTLFELLL